MTSTKIERTLQRLACSSTLLSRYGLKHLEQTLLEALPSQSLVLALETCAYDETPMKVSIRGVLDTVRGGNPDMAKVAASIGLPLLALNKRAQTLSSGCVAIRSHAMGHLQSMGKANGQVLKTCLEKQLLFDSGISKFGLKHRVVTTDHESYNKVGEELLFMERLQAHGFLTSIIYCDTHGLANSHCKSVEALHCQSISGMLHLSLSLRFVQTWDLFVTVLAEEVGRAVTIKIGVCTPAAEEYKLSLLRLVYMGGDGNHLDQP
eukprot:3462028-Amphidinium_carterae.1